MDKKQIDKLKSEISKRWAGIKTNTVAHAQLEYILQEAGLLAKTRQRRNKKAETAELPL